MTRLLVIAIVLSGLAGTASADSPYSLAWQLRPAAAATVVRSDTAVAMYGDGGSTVASTFLASYQVTPELAPLFRIAVSHDSPEMAEGATSLSNPLLGVTWAPKLLAPPLRFAAFGALTLPTGSGDANRPAVLARSAMDNALFATNDATLIVGADLAWVKDGFTVQGEVTLLELVRVRNADMQPDAAKTNFTSGLHAGWFPIPAMSIGAELRYQRYLSTPAFVVDAPAARDTLSAAIGIRGHVELGGKRWLRPGIAYARGLDDPMDGRGYDVIQIDVPVSF